MILKQLGDHTDVTTYYVRAVIKNSISGETLATVNLIDSGGGSRRFYYLYEVPADVSEEGFYIDILTSVYTDSGYTTKSSLHQDDLEQYLVFDRTKRLGGGGGGVDVDYRKIEKILEKTIKPLAKTETLDLGPVLAQIKGVFEAVRAIKVPIPEKLDNTPVIARVAAAEKTILKAIDDKPVTEMPDMNPMKMEMMDAIHKKEPNLEKVFAAFQKIEKILTDYVSEYTSREGAKEKLDEIKEALGPVFRGENFKAKPMGEKKDMRVERLLGMGGENHEEK